jgi:hypothetical protein
MQQDLVDADRKAAHRSANFSLSLPDKQSALSPLPGLWGHLWMKSM